jgi:hypothetical protein
MTSFAISTAEELKQKAAQTRADAKNFRTAEAQAKMLEIASEYERLALRADQLEDQSHKAGPPNLP